jgi:hypothetical protein
LFVLVPGLLQKAKESTIISFHKTEGGGFSLHVSPEELVAARAVLLQAGISFS